MYAQIYNTKVESLLRLSCQYSNGRPIWKYWLVSHDSLPTFPMPTPRTQGSGRALACQTVGLQWGYSADHAITPSQGSGDKCRLKQRDICLHIVYHAQTPLAWAACHRQQQSAASQGCQALTMRQEAKQPETTTAGSDWNPLSHHVSLHAILPKSSVHRVAFFV